MDVLDPSDPTQQVKIQRRHERWFWIDRTFMPLVALALIVALLGGADLVWNQWLYGDWRCAFINCVRVSEVKKNPPSQHP